MDIIGLNNIEVSEVVYHEDYNDVDKVDKVGKVGKVGKVNYISNDSERKIKINSRGAIIPFKLLNVEKDKLVKVIRKIENYFTLKSIQILGNIKKLNASVVNKNKRYLLVPRFGVYEILRTKYGLKNTSVINEIDKGVKIKNIKWKCELRPNQKLICDYILENDFSKSRVKSGSSGLILNLEPGQGKTFVASYMIGVLKTKTAVILHSTSMIDQWIRDLRVCYGDTVKIGQYHAKKKIDGDIILIVINSSISDEFKINKKCISYKEFYKDFGLIILDECHKYANKTGNKLFKRCQSTYMLGLSATPDENTDKFDKLVWWGVGPVLNAEYIEGYQSTENCFTGVVHRLMYYGPEKYTQIIKNNYTDMISTTGTISMICEDKSRNILIINKIIECLNSNLFTYVFADRRDYLDILKNQLMTEKNKKRIEVMYNEDDYTRLVGGAKNDELDKAANKSKVIFTTYQFMGTGKSIPKMNAIILATPRKSKMKQYIGRIFRLGSDATITRQIYDIVDMKISLKNQWSTRKKYYNENNFEINQTKILYSDLQPIVKKVKNNTINNTQHKLHDKIKNKFL